MRLFSLNYGMFSSKSDYLLMPRIQLAKIPVALVVIMANLALAFILIVVKLSIFS